MTDSPNILALRVDDQGPGSPALYAVLDKQPENTVFEAFDIKIGDERALAYVGRSDNGKGSFFTHYTSTSNKNGFGGAKFTLPMADGTTREVVGPWSGSGTIHAATGQDVTSMPYKVMTVEHAEKIWTERYERLARMKTMGLPEVACDSKDVDLLQQRLGTLENLLWSTELDRMKTRFFAAGKISDSHYTTLNDTSKMTWDRTRTDIAWAGSPEQMAFAAEILVWEGGMYSGVDVSIEVALDAMKKMTPQWTLYPYRWRPQPLMDEIGHRDSPRWVPAQKSSAILIVGGEVPAPKKEGWWGYAVHDSDGYPQSRFYPTVSSLIDDFSSADTWGPAYVRMVMTHIHGGDWTVSGRHEARWEALSRDQQALVDRMARTMAKVLPASS